MTGQALENLSRPVWVFIWVWLVLVWFWGVGRRGGEIVLGLFYKHEGVDGML